MAGEMELQLDEATNLATAHQSFMDEDSMSMPWLSDGSDASATQILSGLETNKLCEAPTSSNNSHKTRIAMIVRTGQFAQHKASLYPLVAPERATRAREHWFTTLIKERLHPADRTPPSPLFFFLPD